LRKQLTAPALTQYWRGHWKFMSAELNKAHDGRGGARRGAGRPVGSRNSRGRRHAQRTQAEFQEQAGGYSGEALGSIIRCMRAPDASWADKLRAAFGLIDRVYGRPAQQVQVATRAPVEHAPIRSDAELHAALLAKGCHPSLLPPPFLDKAMIELADEPPPLPSDDAEPTD
jgi:hypothetical protein